MESQGITLDQYLQITGMTKADLNNQFKPQALKQIKTRLVLEEVAKKNAAESGGSFKKVNSMAEAFKDADIVYPKSWAPFAAMETHYMYYVSAVDSYHRLGKILHAEVIADKTDGVTPAQNDIVFKDVAFSYEEDEFKMNGINFSVPEKTMTALVGESGSGKTTVTNLLLRFYDVQGGSITLGGTDIRDIPYDELLDRISIVMQNVQLFDNTIEENIRVGKKEATNPV